MLGPFNNYNIIKLSHKATTSEDLKEIHQVVIDVFSVNMASLVKYGDDGATNTTYTLTMGYYVNKFFSEAYILQDDTTC